MSICNIRYLSLFVECVKCCVNRPFNAVLLSLQSSASILDNVPMPLNLEPLNSSAEALSPFWPNNNMAKPPTPPRHRPSHHTSRHICRTLRAAASAQSTWVKRGEFFPPRFDAASGCASPRRARRGCLASEQTRQHLAKHRKHTKQTDA